MIAISLCMAHGALGQEDAVVLPTKLPVGMELVKDIQRPRELEKATGALLPVRVTFRVGTRASEKIEEFADGSQAVSYVAANYFVSRNREGVVIADMRVGAVEQGMSPFDELEWLSHSEIRIEEKSPNVLLLEAPPNSCEIDKETELPRSARVEQGIFRYSYRQIPPNSVRVPPELAQRVVDYENWLKRPSVSLHEDL